MSHRLILLLIVSFTCEAPVDAAPVSIPDAKPLHRAAREGAVEELARILDVQPSLVNAHYNDETPLYAAVSAGRYEAAELLLERGALTDISSGQLGETPLHAAALRGNEKLVRLLLDHRAYIDATQKVGGKRPLHLASMLKHVSVVRLLLERNAQVDAGDDHGSNALHWAAGKDWSPEVIEMLLAAGADPNNMSLAGMNPLARAASHDIDLVRRLLEAGAEPDPPSRGVIYPHLPLDAALSAGKTDIARLLIERRADPTRPDALGAHMIRYAVIRDDPELYKLLQADLKNVSFVTKEGRNLMHFAVFGRRPDMIKKLAELGVDPNVIDYKASTPLDYALAYGEQKLAEELKQIGGKTAKAVRADTAAKE